MISSLHKVIVISMLSALKYIYIIRSADCNKQPERSGLFNNGKYDFELFSDIFSEEACLASRVRT